MAITKLRRGLVAGLAIVMLSACTTSAQNQTTGTASDTLTVAIPPGINSLALPTNCSSPLFSLTYASLINVTADGKYGPGLAESWSYANNNTEFTLKMRSGLKFADGTELNAQSVVDTLKYFQTTPGLNQGYLKPFTSITASDASTVVIKYAEPFIGMETLLANDGECNNGMIISKAGLTDPAKMGTATFGAGPYTLDAANTVSGDHYTLTPNPNYYDTSNQHWKKIVLRVFSSATTALDAVKAGQIQVSTVNDGTLVPTAEAAGVDVADGQRLGAGLMIWDRDGTLTPALKNEKVRQAMQYAIDRPNLAKVLGPRYKAFDQFVPDNTTGYDESLAGGYPYDPAKAKALLAEGGFPSGFKLTVATDAADAGAANMAQAVAQQWKAVGIDTTITPITAGSYFTEVGQKKYSVGAVSYALLGDVYFDAVRLTKDPYADVWNPFHPKDDEVDTAYGKLARASESELPALSVEFNKLITGKAWFVPVAEAPATLYSKNIEVGKSALLGQFDYISWKATA
ncbi:hypothetical protein KOI35_11435 [Actinoplanes bogorensis]|uniref:Solute-binding protein family 5 domain-containing protein n=1 Tax=Paractinoplanes bogorensis TaxID=1610840 RepID=A0ABS5YKV6_9ACTN|nr:ABC transporter substrate-binding protein [Actinoplanes bogorensis]MBU2664104.1 hypothetical protein [Actinoplanes bogorensis]